MSLENNNSMGSSQANKVPASKLTMLVTVICWLAIFIEGYDLVVYGVVMPKLMDPSEWGLSPNTAGAMGSYALLGMFVGSLIGGVITDKLGRKLVLTISLVLLSLMMLLSAISTSPVEFAIYRFVAGLGIGGLVPPACALTIEYAPPKHRSFAFVIMYTGFAFGGVFAALMGYLFVDSMGWRFLFWLGTASIVLIPVVWFILPESIRFLEANSKTVKANQLRSKYELYPEPLTEEPASTGGAFNSLFSKKYLPATVLFSLVYIMAFLLIYGLNTWLPKIMEQAGYPVKSGLLLLLLFNFAAVLGGLLAGRVADRVKPKRVIATTYMLAAVSIALMSFKLNIGLLYILILVAGFGSTGTTFVLASYVTRYYDVNNRASAIGTVSAVGRFGAVAGPIMVGLIVTAGFTVEFNFYFFALIALIASLLILAIPILKKE